jgi:hypothetical protein
MADPAQRKEGTAMGRHKEEYLDPDAFADEVLGTVTEQTLRWYNREIVWREKLANQLLVEVATLKAQREKYASPKEATGPNVVVAVEDPNATQEIDVVAGQEE